MTYDKRQHDRRLRNARSQAFQNERYELLLLQAKESKMKDTFDRAQSQLEKFLLCDDLKESLLYWQRFHELVTQYKQQLKEYNAIQKRVDMFQEKQKVVGE